MDKVNGIYKKRFTGWVDVNLTPQGKLEACKAGELIKKLNLEIDYFFSSYQKSHRNFRFNFKYT